MTARGERLMPMVLRYIQAVRKGLPALAVATLVAYPLVTQAAQNSASSPREDAATRREKGEWRWIGGNSEQQQHSSLSQINDKNVQRLGLGWVAEMPGAGLVGNPLVVDGIVYQSGPPGRIYANDVKTGKLLWTYAADLKISPEQKDLWFVHRNRGLSLDGDTLFLAANCRIHAVDRKTGKRVWDSPSCDPAGPYAIAGAPRAGGGKVFTGNSGGDGGVGRGFVDAFDAKTGRQLWRFYTRPGDPSKPFESPELEMAAKTWGKDYWNEKYVRGGVRVWDAITYDESSDILYFGTSVPGKTPADRAPEAGDELFASSIVAVNATSGKYLWHYSTVQNDGWNLDATMHIMLADLPQASGSPRRVVMVAPKNGFFYVLDANSGKFVSAKNYVPINWATHIDPKTGRPVTTKETTFWEKPGVTVIPKPGEMGAHNWQLMAYQPALGLVYIPVTFASIPMTSNPDKTVTLDVYGSLEPDSKFKVRGELLAWDPVTQTKRWSADRVLSINGGILATDGNLVFQGTSDGKFEAFSADKGQQLWSFETEGAILAAPSTVEVDGVQYVLVPSGNGASAAMFTEHMTTEKTRTAPTRLLAFRLDGNVHLPPVVVKAPPQPSRPKQSADLARKGSALFEENCSRCHGKFANGAPGFPNLSELSEPKHAILKQIVVGGALRPVGMPSFPEMNDIELEAIRAYLINRGWERYTESAGNRQKSASNQR